MVRKIAAARALVAGLAMIVASALAQEPTASPYAGPSAEAIKARRALLEEFRKHPTRVAYEFRARAYYPLAQMVKDGDKVKVAMAPDGNPAQAVHALFSEEHQLPYTEVVGTFEIFERGRERKIVSRQADGTVLVAMLFQGGRQLFAVGAEGAVSEEESNFVPQHFSAGDYIALGVAILDAKATAWTESTAPDGSKLHVASQGGGAAEIAFGDPALELRNVVARRGGQESRRTYVGALPWAGTALPSEAVEAEIGPDRKPVREFRYWGISYGEASAKDFLPPDMDE